MRRAGWGLADQAVSSLGNVAVLIVAARSLPVAPFGAFSLAVLTYVFIIGLQRAIAIEPFLVRGHGSNEHQLAREKGGAAASIAGLLSLAWAALGLMLTMLLPEALRGAAFAISLLLPLLAVQDALRYVAMGMGRPRTAFISDALWTSLAILAMILGPQWRDTTSPYLLFLWGLPALVALAYALHDLRVPFSVAGAKQAWATNRDLRGGFTVEYLAVSGSSRLIFYVVALVTGVATVGALRAGHVLFGPLNVLIFSANTIAIAELGRGRHRPERLKQLSWWLAGGLAGISLVWTLGLLVAGDTVGPLLVGSNWTEARDLVIPLGLHKAAAGVMMGALVGLRLLEAVGSSVRARTTTAVGILLLGVPGALVAEAVGVATGIAIAQAAGAALAVVGLMRADGRRPTAGEATAAAQPASAFPTASVVRPDGAGDDR